MKNSETEQVECGFTSAQASLLVTVFWSSILLSLGLKHLFSSKKGAWVCHNLPQAELKRQHFEAKQVTNVFSSLQLLYSFFYFYLLRMDPVSRPLLKNVASKSCHKKKKIQPLRCF